MITRIFDDDVASDTIISIKPAIQMMTAGEHNCFLTSPLSSARDYFLIDNRTATPQVERRLIIYGCPYPLIRERFIKRSGWRE
ncbi:hypothetical protein D3C76_565980 [compost metagenome]